MEERVLRQEIFSLKIPLFDFVRISVPGEIRWAHRVNTLFSLKRALDLASKGKIHCLEGDVWLNQRGIPVMTHNAPNQKEEYLSLREWIKRASIHRVGLKLDFKTRQAVEPSLFVLKELSVDPKQIILNADILRGPGGTKPSFEPKQFLFQCRNFSPQTLLSIGFTTVPYSSSFSEDMIEYALSLALDFSPATVCLRVEKVTDRIMKKLQENKILVTLWSDQDNPLTPKKWKEIIPLLQQYRTCALMDFPDFPQDLYREIKIV